MPAKKRKVLRATMYVLPPDDGWDESHGCWHLHSPPVDCAINPDHVMGVMETGAVVGDDEQMMRALITSHAAFFTPLPMNEVLDGLGWEG